MCGCLHAVKRGYTRKRRQKEERAGRDGRKRGGRGRGGKDEAPLKLFLRHASLTSSVSWSRNIIKFYDNNLIL